MFNDFEALVRLKEADTLADIVRETCESCGKETAKSWRNNTVKGLLTLGIAYGAAYCFCNFKAFVEAKSVELPDWESVMKLSKWVTTGTNTTGTLNISASGDANGLTHSFQSGDIPRLSEIPAYEKEIQGIEAPVMADSVRQNIVNPNGSERTKPNIKLNQRIYEVGSGNEVRVFKVL